VELDQDWLKETGWNLLLDARDDVDLREQLRQRAMDMRILRAEVGWGTVADFALAARVFRANIVVNTEHNGEQNFIVFPATPLDGIATVSSLLA